MHHTLRRKSLTSENEKVMCCVERRGSLTLPATTIHKIELPEKRRGSLIIR